MNRLWCGLTVYEIFSVEVSHDLENWVMGCSRSLKMALLNRPYTTMVRHCQIVIGYKQLQQELISRLDSQTLCADKVLSLLDFSNK